MKSAILALCILCMVGCATTTQRTSVLNEQHVKHEKTKSDGQAIAEGLVEIGLEVLSGAWLWW